MNANLTLNHVFVPVCINEIIAKLALHILLFSFSNHFIQSCMSTIYNTVLICQKNESFLE